MNFEEIFGKNARWTVYPEDKKGLPLVRKSFFIKDCKKATLTICGLGYFEAYINGKRVSNDYFNPVFSDYFYRDFSHYNYPLPGEKSKHRIYVCRYDVTELLTEGENVLAVILAGGWLTQRKKTSEGKVNFAEEMYLCFTLLAEGEKVDEVVSDGKLKYSTSHIVDSNVYFGEKVNYKKYKEKYFLPGFDDSSWNNPKEREDFGSPLYIQDVPADTVCERIVPKPIARRFGKVIYDVGKNITGWVRLRGKGKVVVCQAESLKGKNLDFRAIGGGVQKQKEEYIGLSDGIEAHPTFRWNGFRYFSVKGRATDIVAEVVHIPFKKVSTFESSNDVLNWIHDAYELTQLNNMHGGIPSDCPHREKLGYTADGQLTTETAILCFDCRSFYRKWMADILDCQDEKTGHVHHTAPLMGGGGGPGGWGGAIVFAPYKYYTMYGEEEYISTFLPAMEKWIEHMINECMGEGEQKNLIVRERKNGWCLGDWCTREKTVIAEPFVNTCLFITALRQYKALCDVCGREFKYGNRQKACEENVISYYWTEGKKTCQKGVQGADFYMADLGLISAEEGKTAAQKYVERGYMDVGIIGIEYLYRYLFENGMEEEGTRLLMSEQYGSFGYMKNQGASTLWEYWDGRKSQNHPMFGSVVKYLYYGVAGIRYQPGFRSITIRPALYAGLSHLKCSLVRPNVTVNVAYEKIEEAETYEISYVGESKVFVELSGERYELESGKPLKLKK